jgi:integrase
MCKQDSQLIKSQSKACASWHSGKPHSSMSEPAPCSMLLQRNASDLVDPPSIARTEMGALSPEHAHALLAAAAGDRFEAFYVLAVTTGMRLGELLALRWEAIDLAGRSLQVRASLYHTGREFVFTEPKTAKSRRRVQLPSIAVEALRAHRRRLLAEHLALGAA